MQTLLGLRTSQEVHRLRRRGALIGAVIDNRTWFPAWQFDSAGVRSDLHRILDLVGMFSTDAFAIDRMMRLARDELDGQSIAEALRRPVLADTAWRLMAAVGA